MSEDLIKNVVHPEFLKGVNMVIKLVQDWSKDNLPDDQPVHISADFNNEPTASVEVFTKLKDGKMHHVRTISADESEEILNQNKVAKRSMADMNGGEKRVLSDMMKDRGMISLAPVMHYTQRLMPTPYQWLRFEDLAKVVDYLRSINIDI